MCLSKVKQTDLPGFRNVVACFEETHDSVSLASHPTTTTDRSCLLFIVWVSDWCRYVAPNPTAGTYSSGLLCPPCILPEVKDNAGERKMIINNHNRSSWLFPWSLWGEKFPVADAVWQKECQKPDPFTTEWDSRATSTRTANTKTLLHKYKDDSGLSQYIICICDVLLPPQPIYISAQFLVKTSNFSYFYKILFTIYQIITFLCIFSFL